METDILRKAAAYYLAYNGKKITEKQIDKLLSQSGPLVLRLAQSRGFKI
jgi:predicted secreted Zn-dependent protease